MEHPSVIVAEEMEEREWDRDRLALEMVRGTDANYGIARLALDFFFDIGPTDPHCQMGRIMCAQMDRAFGVSDGFFSRLERSYLDLKGIRPVDETRSSDAVDPHAASTGTPTPREDESSLG